MSRINAEGMVRMDLQLTVPDNLSVRGQGRFSRANARCAKLVSRVITTRFPGDRGAHEDAMALYETARGTDDRVANPFEVLNQVLVSRGQEPFPSVTINNQTRYTYTTNGVPSPGSDAYAGFRVAYALQRDIGEMIFYSAIQRHNETVDIAHGGRPILMSEAIQAHDAWLREYLLGSRLSPASSLNNVLTQRLGLPEMSMRAMQQIAQQYRAMTGIDDEGVVHGIYPLSPYDDRFRDFASSYARGSRMGYIDLANEPEGTFTIDDLQQGAINETIRSLNVIYDRQPGSASTEFETIAERGQVSFERSEVRTDFADATDLAGLGRLRPYMRPEEFNAMVAHVNESWSPLLAPDFDWTSLGAVAEYSDVLPMAGSAGNDAARSAFLENANIAVERAARICEALIDNGYDYEVRPAREPGQVELQVVGTGVTVRIMDKPSDIVYVGRVNDRSTSTQSYVVVEVDKSNRAYMNGRSIVNIAEEESRRENPNMPDSNRKADINGRANVIATSLSYAMNFEVDSSVFVNNVLYTLGHDVVDERGHRLGEGDWFVRGASSKDDVTEYMNAGTADTFALRDGQRANGLITVRTETDNTGRVAAKRFVGEPTMTGAKLTMASMVSSARSEFYNQVNIPELAEAARREAQAAFDRNDGIRPDEMALPDDVTFGEHAISDPSVSRLREAYWRAMCAMEYDGLVAQANGEEPPAPRYVLANMGYAPDRIYDSLSGVLVETERLDTIAAEDGEITSDVVYMDAYVGPEDTLHSAGMAAVEAHLQQLMTDYFGAVLAAPDDENNRAIVNYFDLSDMDREQFGDTRTFLRYDAEGPRVGRDSTIVTGDSGKSYPKRGIEQLESAQDRLEGTAFEDAEMLDSSLLASDTVSIDFAHVLAFQPSGSYSLNKQSMRNAYLRMQDYIEEHPEAEGELEIRNPEAKGTTRFLDETLRFGDNGVWVKSLHDLREEVKSEEGLSTADAFRLRMLDAVERTLKGSRCQVSDENILIDGNGVVQYEAKRVRRMSGKLNTGQTIHGTLGQIFVPEEHGLYDVKFGTSTGYLLAGGNFVYALNQMSHDGDYLDRLRVKGFDDIIEETICREVRQRVVSARNVTSDELGYSTSLNARWRDDVVGTRFVQDVFEDELCDQETIERRVAAAQTKCRLVGYDPQEETSIVVSERTNRMNLHDYVDDRSHGGQGLTGRRETSHVDEAESALFDYRMLPNDKKCALTRYLVADAQVEEDGSITPGSVMGRNVLTQHSALEFCDFDAFNRSQMGQSNIMHATSVDTEPVAFAQVVFGGWNQDDTIIISKHFAETHLLEGAEDIRSLIVGDKLGETHGNKGLVGIVVDPDMDIEAEIAKARAACMERVNELRDGVNELRKNLDEFNKVCAVSPHPDDEVERRALELDLKHAEARLKRAEDSATARANRMERDFRSIAGMVEFFDKNRGGDGKPPLDVVYSPFSPLSRLNAGLAREAFSHERYDLECLDGTIVKGGIGMARFIVHDKPVDKKTNWENGRRNGFQMAHALQSAGCDIALEDMYASNGHAMRSMREAARTSYGYDILDDGTMTDTIEYPAFDDASVYQLDEHLELTDSGAISNKSVDSFVSWMMVRGGYMELPFQLEWPEVSVQMSNDEAEAYKRKAEVIAGDNGVAKVTFMGNELPVSRETESGQARYLMPVMAAEERRGVTSTEGGYKVHDHTDRYRSIYTQAVKYMQEQKVADGLADTLVEDRDYLEQLKSQGLENSAEYAKREKLMNDHEARIVEAMKKMDKAQAAAQSVFSSLAQDVRERAFDSKENYAKTKFMGGDMPGRYATAAWTGDPRLDLDEVGVGPDLARELGLREGDMCLVWRAPCLTEATARAFRVHIDDEIYGVRVNPEVAKPIGGDFDGDTIGIGRPYSRVAMNEMADKLSVARELVNRRRDGHGLFMGKNTDLTFAGAYHPEISEKIADIERRAQAAFDRHRAAGTVNEGLIPAVNESGEPVLNDKGNTVLVSYLDEMVPLLHELNDVVHEGYAQAIGVGALSFESPGAYLQSVVDVNINTGAKGGLSGLERLARNLGVDNLQVDDVDGHMVIRQECLRVADSSLQRYADYQSTQDAGALKSYATGEVGKFQQKFFAAFPGEVEMCDALTEPIYQMSLDWKHDGEIARKQHAMIPVFNGLLSGYEYELKEDKMTGEMVFRQVGSRNDAGYFVPNQDTNREHWKDMLNRAFAAVDKDGFDPVYMDRLAEGLWVGSADGTVGHIEGLSDRAQRVSSPLSRAAFTEGSKAFVLGAISHDNLFEVHTGDPELDRRVSATFAPKSVRKAMGWDDIEQDNALASDPVLDKKVSQKTVSEPLASIASIIEHMPQKPSSEELAAAASSAQERIAHESREPADDSDIAKMDEVLEAMAVNKDDKEVS